VEKGSASIDPHHALLLYGCNIDSDPAFRNPSHGDFHILPASPCLDRGWNDTPLMPAIDFEGDERILDGDGDGIPVADMGADEAKE
jgi:hypothetical protein